MTALVQNLSRLSTTENVETAKNVVWVCAIGLIVSTLYVSVLP